jgi:hypothetical protein
LNRYPKGGQTEDLDADSVVNDDQPVPTTLLTTIAEVTIPSVAPLKFGASESRQTLRRKQNKPSTIDF